MDGQKRIEELERLVQESRLQIESERQRAESERQRAESERQRAEAAEEQTRSTTLEEYIEACHSLVFSRLEVEIDKKLTSRGSITNPRNKLCPTNLQPWAGFLKMQRIVSGVLHGTVPAEAQLFESRNFLSGLGDRISRRPIANEKGLEYFLHNSVEDPVRSILQQLKEIEEIRSAYEIGGGIIFENHPSALSDIAEEVIDRQNSSPPKTPEQRLLANQLRPDQICVYRSEGGQSTGSNMIYVCEYKAPHKLTAAHLRVGLRPMDVHEEVVNRRTIPTSADPEGRFQYHAERLTAAAISQTYHYMIEGGLEYGLLTTGEATVFLKIDWRDPQTLYYHLAEPGPEVSAHPDQLCSCTAVGQHLAFTLTALGRPGHRREHGQDERRRAIHGLKTWAEDFESALRSIPANERSAPNDSSYYEPTTYKGIDRSPYPFRRERRPVGDEHQPTKQATRRDSPESSDDEPRQSFPYTPSPAERPAGKGEQGRRRSQRIRAQQRGTMTKGASQHTAQYCTQKCLIGLVQGGFLDMRCPNVKLHDNRRINHVPHRITRRHPVSHGEWLQLLSKQLAASLDEGVTPLRENGSRGAIFRVTLLRYSYTFIGKGTIRDFIKDLEHEAAVYKHLQALQGSRVPVFLGAIDLQPLKQVYYYDHRAYIVHFTFLSWSGYKLDRSGYASGMGKRLKHGAMQTLELIHRAGVAHQDVRTDNALYNPETGYVMMFDFERSAFVQPRRALAQLAHNKQSRRQKSSCKALVQDLNSDECRIEDDILMASSAFLGLNCYAVT